MNFRQMMNHIYRLRLEHDVKRSSQVVVTFYSSGHVHERPLTESDIDIVDGKLRIRVEDN